MDKNEAINIARKYIDNVNKKYKVENAILFGSYAKGTNREDSDIDLALVFHEVNDIVDMQVDLMRLRTDDDLFIEPHPFTIADFNNSNPVVAEILKKGIEIKN